MTNVDEILSDGSPRKAGPAEREELAGLFEAIGNAANSTILNMPDFSDEVVRRQIVHSFASAGGFVMYADMLRQGTRPIETGPTDSVRSACRAPTRTRAGPDRCTDRRGAQPGRASRPPTRRARTWRRSVAQARRAGVAGRRSTRCGLRAFPPRPRRTRAGRRGTSGSRHRAKPRLPSGPRGRRAGCRRRRWAALRPGARGRPRPCRCRAPASR